MREGRAPARPLFACGVKGNVVRYLHLYMERRPLVKLQKGIVLGEGHKLALAVGLVVGLEVDLHLLLVSV